MHDFVFGPHLFQLYLFSVNTCRKDRWENLYYVAIGLYSKTEGEKYIRTDYKVIAKEWEDKTPKDKQRIYEINRALYDRVRAAHQLCGVNLTSKGEGSHLDAVT